MPYVDACVFLSDPKLRSELSVQGRHNVFGRDAERGCDLPPERAVLGGICDHLTGLGTDRSGRHRRRIQRPDVNRLDRAVKQIGIRERSSRREIGDYRITKFLGDVEADTTDAISYQDFLGKHRSLDLQRRLRVYPLEHNVTAEKRETAQRAAKREFQLLHPLAHEGILHPHEFAEHERGPVLIFDYDPAEVTLAAFLADPANCNLSVEARLTIIRHLAEALAFANGKKVFHRALCPSAVLLTPAERPGAGPRVRITNWHTGARVADDNSESLLTGTVHAHVEALAASDAPLFRAPEFALPAAKPVVLDVFSLGAMALFILTGQRPASSVRQLRSTLLSARCLDPTTVTDGVDPRLAELIVSATRADPVERLRSAGDFLLLLDVVEQEWATADDGGEVHPLEARRGDSLREGRLEVVQRLGRGATAVALLVKDAERFGRLCVAKVAHDRTHNDRLLSEAAVLEGLQHPAIAGLLEDPFELSGHTAILIGYAGPKVDPSKPELKASRTLAGRLRDDPVGVELAQRWGEDLLDALRYLEGMGRAHRDIKPDNLGVAPRGENDELHLVLFDFSLAGAPVEAIEVGTRGYLDPFLELRGRWDPSADRYAAAVTLFEMVTGTKPRYGDGTADPAIVAADPTVDPALFDSAVAGGLTSFFTRALQPETANRFGTADEMYWAWHEAFDAADAPSTPSLPPDDDGLGDLPMVPHGATTEWSLAALPLSRRAVSALERAEILTVGDLLAQPIMQIRSLPGVGAGTRAEILDAHDQLASFFGGPALEPAEAQTGSLADIAHSAIPSARRDGQQDLAALARILVGLEPHRDPWVPQSDLADWLGIDVGSVSGLVAALRERWRRNSNVTPLRVWIQDELGPLRVASVEQIAGRLLLTRPGAGSSPGDDVRLAHGAVRLATLAEEGIASPGWVMRRCHSAVLLAARSATDADAGASALADYAVRMADAAAELVEEHQVVTRRQLVDRLHGIALPSGAVPLPDGHLADLVADLCESAAVNSRLEFYRIGLPPVGALRSARRTFVTGATFSPSDIADRISARFPEAADLPDRPDLDQVLQDAGVDLLWREADGTYTSPQYEQRATSTAVDSSSRYPTNVATPVPAIEIDNAEDFQDRLERARNNGSVLVLVTDANELARAEQQLGRLADATVNADEWLAGELESLTASGKPSWNTLAAADAAGANGASWGRLRSVVDSALERFTERLLATDATLLLTNPGLLARYDRLDVLAAWRDALHDGDHRLKALWLLMPSTVASDVPLLNGRAVPVISRNEWSRIPADWLRNAHRAGRPDPVATP